MAILMKRAALLLAGTIAASLYASVAMAADIANDGPLPAVSGPNGKVQIGAGFTDIDDLSSDEVFSGGVAFSIPVGDMFGIQADLTALDAFGETSLMLALCPEAVDMERVAQKSWYTSDARDASVELGVKGGDLILTNMRRALGRDG